MDLKTSFLVLLICTFFVFGFCDTQSTEVKAETPPSEPKDAMFSPEQRAAVDASAKKYEFQAEVTRLMDIIINSLYKDREIFLRELISNAADACDKIRYEGLLDKSKLGEVTELDIRVSFDKDTKSITVWDKGVGMTREQLIKNLGVVAHSGTTEFLEKVAKGGTDPVSLIGQFGVGFYSVYLVADKVTVISKHNDDDQYIWESKADKTFSVSKDPRGNTLGRGTMVTLYLKEDAEEFLHDDTLKRIATRYSEFIQYPIYLQTTKEVEKEVPDEEAIAKEKEEEKKDEDISVEEEEKKEEKPKTKKVKESVKEWTQINTVKAIWTRNPKDITDEEYDNFYKSFTKDDRGMLRHTHFKAEGELTFKAILYVPKKAPDGYYDRFYEKSNALKLYVRKVLISDEFEDLMPRYLSFVKGVVDSDDLPLNVNRDTLAQHRVIKVMGKKLTRKALEMLKKIADDSDEAQDKDKDKEEEKKDEEESDKPKDKDIYGTFWKEFGKSVKLGVVDDRANKVMLAKLLRYPSSKSDAKLRSLTQYVQDMPEKQNYIYYITGESLDVIKKSPFLEKLVKKGYEVLFMADPLDEYVVQTLADFEGKKLMSVTKEGLKIGDENKDKDKKQEEEFKDFTAWLKGIYGDKVEKVVVSNRLAKSPCVLVTSQYGWSANMERIMKAQTFSNSESQQYMIARKTMEINPRHPLIQELKRRTADDANDSSIKEMANLLYDSALISSGFVLQDPTDFSSRLQRVIALGLKVDPNSPVEEEAEEPSSESSESSPEEANTPKDDL